MHSRLAVGLAAALTVLGASTPAFAAGGPAPRTTAPSTPAPTAYFPVDPHRVLDTRGSNSFMPCDGSSTLGPNSSVSVTLATCMDHMPPRIDWAVPSNATAVVVNVTATNATADTYVSIGAANPQWQGQPAAFSTLNVSPGHDVANLATVPVAQAGFGNGISIYNHAGNVDVVIDVLGYYAPPASTTQQSERYTPLTPCRLLDTRNSSPLGWGGQRTVQVSGVAGVPANAVAAVVNVTATGGTNKSFLTAYPGGALPVTSTVNFDPGEDIANQAIVPLASDGTITVYNHAGSVDAVVDVVGYYSVDGQGLFTPVTPNRLLDTRTISGYPGLESSAGLGLQVAGHGGIPSNAIGAVLNVTATDESIASHLTVWPHGQSMPGTSSLNFYPSTDVANHVQTALGTGGVVDFSNHAGTTQVVVDAYGYFTAN